MDTIASTEYWAGTDMVFQCLIDRKRAEAFQKAIQAAVKEGDVVVDVGTGTGILSLFAANAGAAKIYAVEADRNLYKTLERNFRSNGYHDKITLIKGNATQVDLPEKVDVVICEMIATGLIDELQIPVMNNILRFCKPNAKILPSRMSSFIDLVETKNIFYGYKMQVIQYEYEWDMNIRSESCTEKYMYADTKFTERNQCRISVDAPIIITKNGRINGLRITNETYFPNGSIFGDSAAYCMPLVLPIEEMPVHIGDIFKVILNYEMCNGMENVQFSVNKI